MKKKKKILIPFVIIGAVLVTVIAAVLIFGNRGGEARTSVRVEPVSRMDLESSVVLKGTLTGTDSALVYSKSDNRIASIAVKEGDYVKTGQTLCELETDDSADLMLEKAEISLSEANRAKENTQFLFDHGAASADEVLQAENNARLAELQLEELQREAAATVTSPIDGTVTRVNTAVGKLAGGSNAEALFQIENIEKLQMRLNVSEYDIRAVRKGQEVRVSAEAAGKKKYRGIVESIAPTGEAKSPGSNEMVVPVVAAVTDDTDGLFAGITARAEIITGSVPDALTVPVDAVVEDTDTDSTYVFVVRDGIAVKTEVTILLESSFYDALAEDGSVAEGDLVVLSPDASLQDGAAVVTEETGTVE